MTVLKLYILEQKNLSKNEQIVNFSIKGILKGIYDNNNID